MSLCSRDASSEGTGTSRSALFARAVEKELDEEESSVDVIDRINAVVDAVKDDTREFTRRRLAGSWRRMTTRSGNPTWRGVLGGSW